jgi:cellulose synthase/poly-beta-1,6-N-acetylglucosamine synthase-like glycosyltransferase
MSVFVGIDYSSPTATTVAILRAGGITATAYNKADETIVIDDGSTGNTSEVARSLGVTVLSPPQNTGLKAGAQIFALPFVSTEFCRAIDADTELAPDAVEKIVGVLNDPDALRTGWRLVKSGHTVAAAMATRAHALVRATHPNPRRQRSEPEH